MKNRWEEILLEFGHPVLDSHTTLERELAEHIAELEERIKELGRVLNRNGIDEPWYD